MEQGAKPAKAKVEAKPPVPRKSRKIDGSSGRQLEQRLAEALDQQAATSAILRVISSARTDVQAVLDTIVASAARLCDSIDAQLFRVDREILRPAASYGSLPKITAVETRPLSRGSVNGRAVVDRRTIHVHDLASESESEWPEAKAFQRRFGHRTTLATPLLRDGIPLGVLTIRRMEVRPFSDDQIRLLETFADQAVIAIENVRLFTELQERNRDLTEALEQQTATSEILRVISGSPTDVQPVFDGIARNSVTLCGSLFANVFRFDGELVHWVSSDRYASNALEILRSTYPMRPSLSQVSGRAILTKAVVRMEDALADPDYDHRFAHAGGWRRMLGVPMLREGNPIGVIVVGWAESGPIPKAQEELLKTFADQAVIAIENVRLFKELEDKSRQLEMASRHKSEFLANMSHELRTPLNAIIGFSEVLAEKMFGEINDKQAEYLTDILESGRHLLSLINDILDLSKIEAGRMELEPADFDLPGAIDNTLTLVRERAHRRGITLLRNVDECLGMIRADERKVKQVLLNLLSNALKFTPEGGQIDVRASVHDGAAEISVTDSGVGIALEDQAAVFEEFRQVGAAAKKIEGTGLGLAISRKFIELHGGKIWVRSEMGAGSTFTFALPLTIDQRHQTG